MKNLIFFIELQGTKKMVGLYVLGGMKDSTREKVLNNWKKKCDIDKFNCEINKRIYKEIINKENSYIFEIDEIHRKIRYGNNSSEMIKKYTDTTIDILRLCISNDLIKELDNFLCGIQPDVLIN